MNLNLPGFGPGYNPYSRLNMPNFPGFAPTPSGHHFELNSVETGSQHYGYKSGFMGPGFGWMKTEGYAIDLNRNGRYDKGRDGVLAFDFNRNGRFDPEEVQLTNDMVRARRGDLDMDNSGALSLVDAQRRAVALRTFMQVDTNRDGRLSASEISANRGGVWMDSDGNGISSPWEQHSVYRIPNGLGRTQQLSTVDPFARASLTQNSWDSQAQYPYSYAR